jgi:hypothetical protein
MVPGICTTTKGPPGLQVRRPDGTGDCFTHHISTINGNQKLGITGSYLSLQIHKLIDFEILWIVFEKTLRPRIANRSRHGPKSKCPVTERKLSAMPPIHALPVTRGRAIVKHSPKQLADISSSTKSSAGESCDMDRLSWLPRISLSSWSGECKDCTVAPSLLGAMIEPRSRVTAH